MNIFRSKIFTKILPFLTARYTILCTRRLQPPRDDCAGQVQWFSSVMTSGMGMQKRHALKSINHWWLTDFPGNVIK